MDVQQRAGGGLFRSSSGRFKELLEGLKADGDLARQIESLNKLCEILCMATEDSLQVGCDAILIMPRLYRLFLLMLDSDLASLDAIE